MSGVARVLVVVVAACGAPAASRERAPTKAAPAAPADSCAHVADHLLSLMSDTARDAPTEDLDRIRGELSKRCTDDAWSVDARSCFLALSSRTEVDRCAEHLTPAQRDALAP